MPKDETVVAVRFNKAEMKRLATYMTNTKEKKNGPAVYKLAMERLEQIELGNGHAAAQQA